MAKDKEKPMNPPMKMSRKLKAAIRAFVKSPTHDNWKQLKLEQEKNNS